MKLGEQMKDAYWFPHDSNARHDPRIVRLRMIHGLAGVGFFWCCVEFLRDQNKYQATREEFEALEFEMGNPVGVFDTLLECGLIESEGEHYHSQSLRNRMFEWDERKRKLSEAGKRGGRPVKAIKKGGLRQVKATSKPTESNNITVQEITVQDSTVHNNTETTRSIPTTLKRGGDRKPAKSTKTWESYKDAYLKRYGAEPLRDRSSNAMICKFIDRVGIDASPHVAAYYLKCSNQWYITKGHDVQTMLGNAQKLHTEWKTGNRLSTHQAHEADRLQGVGDSWERVIAAKCDKE